MEEKKYDRISIGIYIVIFLLLVLPMLYIARYNHSSADDYLNGILTRKAWIETHSLVEVIKVAIQHVVSIYNSWQGSFIAVFLMAIQPAVFAEEYYCITTILLMGMFILSNLYISKVILKNYLKCSRKEYWLISLLIISFSIQFLPHPVEGFYWYNGSIYYTFFYSIMLILFGTILKFVRENKKSKKVIEFSSSIIIAIIIGGGNYVTGLICVLILFILTLLLAMKKNKKAFYVGIVLIVCLVIFMINVLAPGNAIRQEIQESSRRTTEIDAIIYSFKYAFFFIIKWMNKSVCWLYIFLIPILLKIVRKTDYKYKMPVLFSIMTVCIYSAQFTPPIYAQNGFVPPRIFDIIYFSMYWLIVLNLTYWLGWMNNKFNIEENSKSGKYLYIVLLILGIIIISTEYKYSNSYIAIKSIQTGEAQRYHNEINERLILYNDKTITDIEFKGLKEKPYLLFFSDVRLDSNDWINEAAADFYNKNSVKKVE